jgi:hypothetical protein
MAILEGKNSGDGHIGGEKLRVKGGRLATLYHIEGSAENSVIYNVGSIPSWSAENSGRYVDLNNPRRTHIITTIISLGVPSDQAL